jgi:hypothetical protein
VHVHHHVNIRIVVKPCEGKSECPGLAVVPAGAIELCAVPSYILQTVPIYIAGKEGVLANCWVFFAEVNDAAPKAK